MHNDLTHCPVARGVNHDHELDLKMRNVGLEPLTLLRKQIQKAPVREGCDMGYLVIFPEILRRNAEYDKFEQIRRPMRRANCSKVMLS